jgi:diguanylate cyclase (GGDEF)-like protein
MPKPFMLVVEDERDIAALFRHLMDLAGYRTEIAPNGDAAIHRLYACEPDAVRPDLSLPQTSGAQVLQVICSSACLKRVVVIVVTAHAELAAHLPAEPDLVLLKPVSSEQLITLAGRIRDKSNLLETAALYRDPWDTATGVYNRGFFLHCIDSAIQSMQGNEQNLFAVLSIISDAYAAIQRLSGTLRADEFLKGIASALKACVRPTDTVARFEGAHFRLLTKQAPGLQIPDMIASRVQKRLRDQPMQTGNGQFFSCSIGVLLCDARYGDASLILRDAWAASALAEEAGPALV